MTGSRSKYRQSAIGKLRHIGSIPEDSGSKYKSAAFSLKWGGMCQLEKPENLSFPAQTLFELSQKKQYGGGQTDPPRQDRVYVVFIFLSLISLKKVKNTN